MVVPVAALPARVELSLFDGSDPRAWLARAEQFFTIYPTSAEARVQHVYIVMTSGDALYWLQGCSVVPLIYLGRNLLRSS